MLDGKNILLGITGSIAAYKSAQLCRDYIRQGATVRCAMTEAATKFISPMTFETLTGSPVITDMFKSRLSPDITHISWAKWADIFVIAPATANIIAKAASGIADDYISTTMLATGAPILIAPAMNSAMFDNAITQSNIAKLKEFGYHFVIADCGLLACGDVGSGRLAELNKIVDATLYALSPKPLRGTKAIVTAGATREAIDPVRFLSNPATGRMGYEIARFLKAFGADVTLISGKTEIEAPYGVELVTAISAADMYQQAMKRLDTADICVANAAVSDWTPRDRFDRKVKKEKQELTLDLIRTQDILFEAGIKRRDEQIIVGFALETDNLIENARKKLTEKNLDIIIANPQSEDSGFEVDTNRGHIIHKDGKVDDIATTSKQEMAKIIVECISGLYEDKN